MIPFLLFVSLLLTASQACPLTDTYLSRCHCGILTNGESYIKCDEKTLDRIPAFKRSFPYDELILSNNNIETLPRSAFDNIKTIKRVNLENNSLSFIDDDLLRLLGNYLEELILTGDGHLSSLEFLVRYPLKNLRVLKLNQFDLSSADFRKLFRNMTKLEVVSLRACQIKRLPVLPNVQVLDLENNQIANSISLSASYTHLNLARNFVTSIRLPANSPLRTLNLSENSLSSFDFSLLNANLTSLNLNANRLLAVSLNSLPESLTSLSLSHNLIKQIKIAHKQQFSLSSLDLSYNQLRTIEIHPLFDQLEELHLNNNPLECTCHLTWLQKLAVASKRINASTWTCLTPKPCSFLSSDFQCVTKQTSPRVLRLNISYVKISTDNGLFIQWNVRDDDKILTAIQISISEPFYLSPKLRANQTEIFLANQIQPNKRYHICLILSHKYARDKYCREFLTDQLVVLLSNEIVIDKPSASLPIRNFDMNVYMMLIGSCLGGILTFLLIFLCCYLCFQIHQTNARRKNAKNLYYSRNVTAHYPVYQSHSATCPYHHHENLSNSTDSSQMDGSLSTTNLKHIYQTIDSQEYSNLKHDNQLFDLWNESLRQKR